MIEKRHGEDITSEMSAEKPHTMFIKTTTTLLLKIVVGIIAIYLCVSVMFVVCITYVERNFARISNGMPRHEVAKHLRFFRVKQIVMTDIERGWRNQIPEEILKNDNVIIEKYIFIMFDLILNEGINLTFRLMLTFSHLSQTFYCTKSASSPSCQW